MESIDLCNCCDVSLQGKLVVNGDAEKLGSFTIWRVSWARVIVGRLCFLHSWFICIATVLALLMVTSLLDAHCRSLSMMFCITLNSGLTLCNSTATMKSPTQFQRLFVSFNASLMRISKQCPMRVPCGTPQNRGAEGEVVQLYNTI